MRDKIIIIEDDAALAAGLGRALASQQRDIRICGKLADARKLMAGSTPALIILDVNLPDGSGFEFLKELRQQSDVPVILRTIWRPISSAGWKWAQTTISPNPSALQCSVRG